MTEENNPDTELQMIEEWIETEWDIILKEDFNYLLKGDDLVFRKKVSNDLVVLQRIFEGKDLKIDMDFDVERLQDAETISNYFIYLDITIIDIYHSKFLTFCIDITDDISVRIYHTDWFDCDDKELFDGNIFWLKGSSLNAFLKVIPELIQIKIPSEMRTFLQDRFHISTR